jgi:elongator complex protein 3
MADDTRTQAWYQAREYSPAQLRLAEQVLEAVRSGATLQTAVRQHPLPHGGYLPKHLLIYAYNELLERGEWEPQPELFARLRMKPVRTLSGVTTVTVLTEPHACPGECIFCPTDNRMPKSYLPDEPGAMRGLQHQFDPYRQAASRLEALEAIGHPTDKIELLILGGTWSAYPRAYQRHFVQRCLEALNGEQAATLAEAQERNREADHRNVGLVIETRPDHITASELRHLRRLGVTKVQMGVQSLSNEVLQQNRRGPTVAEAEQAARLLRAAGFKIVMHWMPNLLGSDLAADAADFQQLWDRVDLRPDEIKIYPTQLLPGTELEQAWLRGEYQPYTSEELLDLLVDLKPTIPRYCRVNRVIRDIPSQHVLEGNRRTSLRQDVLERLAQKGERCVCIRCREVRTHLVELTSLVAERLHYEAGAGDEHFLSFHTPQDQLAAYLRLWLPGRETPKLGLQDLEAAAIVRELHVYGPSLPLGETAHGAAQHSGLGARLMMWAEEIAQKAGFRRMAVIAALGTRDYYARLGYQQGESYMVKGLAPEDR